MPAGRVIDWWSGAWSLFIRAPIWWVLFSLAVLVASVLVSALPVVGAIVPPLLGPAVMGAALIAAQRSLDGQDVSVGAVWVALQPRLSTLVVVGVLISIAWIVLLLMLALVAFLGAGIGLGASLLSGAADGFGFSMLAVFGTMLLLLLLLVPASVLFWLAPALVIRNDTDAFSALKHSVHAVLANLPAHLLHVVLGIAAAIVAAIPMGLGFVLLLPVAALTLHFAHADIFGD